MSCARRPQDVLDSLAFRQSSRTARPRYAIRIGNLGSGAPVDVTRLGRSGPGEQAKAMAVRADDRKGVPAARRGPVCGTARDALLKAEDDLKAVRRERSCVGVLLAADEMRQLG